MPSFPGITSCSYQRCFYLMKYVVAVNDFRKHLMLSNLSISDVYHCFHTNSPSASGKLQRDECNEIFITQAHILQWLLINKKWAFLYMHRSAFFDPVEAFTKTAVLLEWCTVVFCSIFIFQSHSLSFQWRLLSNRVCP